MADESTPREETIRQFEAVARRAARSVSRDPDVVQDSVTHSLIEYDRYAGEIRDGRQDAWVATVARNRARRLGERAGREIPTGAHGSAPPVHDIEDDWMREFLRRELEAGQYTSIGSLVGNRMLFDDRWSQLSDETQELLVARFLSEKSTKAVASELGIAPNAVDARVHRAKHVVRAVFEDVIDELLA